MITKPRKSEGSNKLAKAQKRLIAKLRRWDEEEKQLGEEIDDIDEEFRMLAGDRYKHDK